MPSSISCVRAMLTVTVYFVSPPALLPLGSISVMLPSKLWPGSASSVTVTGWPMLSLLMSSSSTVRLISAVS